MDMITLKASARDQKAKPKQMRRNNQVPCVVYGAIEKNMHIQCNEKELHKTFSRAGESTLVELDIDGKKVPVLFKDIAFDPISDREVHADFYAVNMKQEIETLVPITFEGESPAVKSLGGVFVIAHNTVRVRCLPSDLPHSLSVDISGMANFHDHVSVQNLTLPTGVKVMDAADMVLASVQEPRAEEVVAAPVTPAEGATAEGATAEGAAAEGATKEAAEKGAKEDAAKKK